MPTIKQLNPSLSTSRGDARARTWLYIAAGATMLMAGALMWTRSLTDWDSWEYAQLAITRQPSGLCLRRWWFIWLMRTAWQIGRPFGATDPAAAFQPMKLAVLLASAGAVAALAAWTYRLTGRVATAAVAAVMGLASPALLLYATTVMTEGPTLLLIALTMICWELAIGSRRLGRAYVWSAVAGLVFGVAVNMREPALFLAAWPIVSCFIDRPRHRWGLLVAAMAGAAASLGFAVLMAWQWSGDDPLAVMRGYSQYMRDERATYGFHGWPNVGYLLTHVLLASPLAALTLLGSCVAALAALPGRRRAGQHDRDDKPGEVVSPTVPHRLAWLGLSTLPYAAMTWCNPNLVFNYRLLLPLAWMLIPIAAFLLDGALRRMTSRMRLAGRRAGAVSAAALLTGAGALMLVAWYSMMIHAVAYNHMQDRIYRRLQGLPDSAVIIPGAGSTSAEYLRQVGGRSDWHVITTDVTKFDWSAEGLRRQLAERIAEGNRAFVNLNPAGWTRPGSDPWEWRNLNEAVSHFDTRPVDDHFVELLHRPN